MLDSPKTPAYASDRYGPYNAEREVWASPMCQEWRNLPCCRCTEPHTCSGDPDHLARDTKLRAVEDACAAAGVVLGEFDRSVLTWLADGDAAVIMQVIAGLVSRARRGNDEADVVVSELARLRRQAVEEHSDGLYLSGLYAGLHDLARTHPALAGVVAERARLWALALTPDAVARGHWSLGENWSTPKERPR